MSVLQLLNFNVAFVFVCVCVCLFLFLSFDFLPIFLCVHRLTVFVMGDFATQNTSTNPQCALLMM